MRILHVCKHFYPRVTGVTAYVDNLGRRQQAAGHEVAAASWQTQEPSRGDEPLPTLRAAPGDGPGLVRLMREFRPDVIHAHSIWETTSLAAAAARELDRPYVLTTHGTWHFLPMTDLYDRWLERLRLGIWRRRVIWPRLLRRAGGVIALNAMEEAEARQAKVAPGRLWRIPNAVDPDVFRPGDSRAAKAALGWPDVPTVLFVGAIQAQKGVFTLLEAAARLDPQTRPRIVLCGEGPDMNKAREAARPLGEGAVFLGRAARETMPGLYQAADATALPSREEPFATVFLEAMAAGRPCIGTNDGGTPEIIEHGHTGLLIPPGDSHALALAIDDLTRHPEKAAAMGRAGRQRVEALFPWSLVAGRIEAVYKHALAAALLLLVLCQSALAARVLPLDILTMIDPRTGQEASSSSGKTPGETNPVWDGKAIGLAAARGETVAFQLVFFLEPGERLRNVLIRVELPGGVGWQAYRAWPIWDTPEVAVPLTGDRPACDIPGRPPDGAGAAPGPYRAWTTVVELAVPREQPAGRLQGQVRLDWDDQTLALPLALSVLPLRLPPRPAFDLEMNSYGDYLRLLPGDVETFLGIHRLMRRFRGVFTLVPYRQSGQPVLDFLAPTLDSRGEPDFTVFDAALGGLLDGDALPDGQPLTHWILPFQADWPAPFAPDNPEYGARNVRVRQAVARHIRDRGWLATRFQEFHNENPENGAQTPWRLDEPVTAGDMTGHDLYLGYKAMACADFGPDCPLRYRIDISSWRPLRHRLLDLAGKTTDWSVSADPRFLDRDAVRFFRALGGEWVVAYGELPGFQTRGQATPWMRFPALLAGYFARGLDGYAQWQTDRWQDKALPGIAAQAVPLVYSSAAGARDFIWPGNAFGLRQALPSLRLFALREGLNLLDYATLASQDRTQAVASVAKALGALGDSQGFYAVKARLAAAATRRSGQ